MYKFQKAISGFTAFVAASAAAVIAYFLTRGSGIEIPAIGVVFIAAGAYSVNYMEKMWDDINESRYDEREREYQKRRNEFQ